VLGGVITDTLDWRWVFLVNVPIAAVGVIRALLVLRDTALVGQAVPLVGQVVPLADALKAHQAIEVRVAGWRKESRSSAEASWGGQTGGRKRMPERSHRLLAL
jgi:MFS family permease